MAKKQLSFRANRETLLKAQYIAAKEGRSMNQQIVQWIKEYVEQFERIHGKIPDNEDGNIR